MPHTAYGIKEALMLQSTSRMPHAACRNSAAYLVAASTLCLALMACTSLPSPSPATTSPFPPLGPLTPAEKAQVIHARTAGLQTLAAVVAMSVSGPAQPRTFEMIVNYEASGNMRFTALKDLFISTRPIFDLLFVGERYYLTLHEDTGPHAYQGAVAHFVRDHPAFRVFLLVGEAFFLPGFDSRGQTPVFQGMSRCITRLRSGAKAEWFIRTETLEITKARVTWQQSRPPASFHLQYRDYRKIGAYYIPARLTLRDRQLSITTQALLKQIDINGPLAPGTFDWPPSSEEQSHFHVPHRSHRDG
jgi:hypothetical protein